MHTVRILTCMIALLFLAGPAFAADVKRKGSRPDQKADQNLAERPTTEPAVGAEDEGLRLKELGLEPLKSFRDCDECPEMVVVPAGSFDMGLSMSGKRDDDPGNAGHRVTIRRAFAIGKMEVTRRQWRAVIGTAQSGSSGCDDCPVENLSWHAAQEFVRRLGIRTGKSYRLPSEAEWEYACRAGGLHQYCGGDSVDSVAWHHGNSRGAAHPTGGKQANAFGLYDMSGNVWEWTADCWSATSNAAPVDGSAWIPGECPSRVIRGGSWQYKSDFQTATSRAGSSADSPGNSDGVRVARTLQ